jgi:hypothetical protein
MSDLEHLRKDAKRLLKQCRASDAAAIARIRSRLQKLSELSDEDFARQVRLAHVQHALAREQGADNWAALAGTTDNALEQLLVQVRDNTPLTTNQLSVLADLSEESIHAACIIGDSDAVAWHLRRDPSLASTKAAEWRPMDYLAASTVYKLSQRHAAGVAECGVILLDAKADEHYDAWPLAQKSGNGMLAKLLGRPLPLSTDNL